MAKAPGTIAKRGEGVWQVQLSTGCKANGSYKRVYKTVHGTKREAQKVLREMTANLCAGVNVKGGQTAFEPFARSWLASKEGKIAERTWRGYVRFVDTLCGVLGSTPLESINVLAVENCMRTIEDDLAKNGRKPSTSTLRGYFGTLSRIMQKAEDADYITRNPCKRVAQPKLQKGTRRSLSPVQYGKMLEALELSMEREYMAFEAKEAHLKETGHQNKARAQVRGVHGLAFLIAARIAHATGARPSEIFALQWDSVDFKGGRISIHQATKTAEGGIKETKTQAGVRALDIDTSLIDALKRWQVFQRNAANKIGAELGLSAFVVCNDKFTQASQNNFNHWWRGWAKANGFEGWQVYELRHSQATLLLDAGLDVKNTQIRMGHSSAAVTLNNYAHATEEGQRRAADIMRKIAANG